jgi:hypothetical protein
MTPIHEVTKSRITDNIEGTSKIAVGSLKKEAGKLLPVAVQRGATTSFYLVPGSEK